MWTTLLKEKKQATDLEKIFKITYLTKDLHLESKRLSKFREKTNSAVRKWAKNLKKPPHFIKQTFDDRWASEKPFSIKLAIREMQVKTTVRYSYTHIRIIKIKKNTDNTKCWQGYGATGTLHTLLVGMQNGKPFWKSVAVSYKFKYTFYDLAIILLEKRKLCSH